MAVKQYNSTADTSVSFPTGVDNPVTVEVWGAGGGGGSSNRSNRTGGGGGGGAYASSSVTVVGGTVYTIAVGGGGAGGNNNSNGAAGGNSHFNNNEVKGAGGQGGTRIAGSGAGGTTANSVGSTLYAGGAGGAGNNSNGYGGGGGAGAGSTGTGQSGTLSVAGVGAGGGGNGGNGRETNVNGNNGEIPGGGGGGAGNNTSLPVGVGGYGANGSVKITYTVTPLVFQGAFDGLSSEQGSLTVENLNFKSLVGNVNGVCGDSSDLGRIRRKTVDPNGGSDYTSIYNWEAGQQKDLTAFKEISVAECKKTGATTDTTSVDIAGWTTSSDYYIKVWTKPTDGYRHTAKPNTGYILSSSSGSYTLQISQSNVQIIGIAVCKTATPSSHSYGIRSHSSATCTNVLIDSCLVYDISAGTSYNAQGLFVESGSSNFTVRNSIIFNVTCSGSTATSGAFGMYAYAGGDITAQNCTVAHIYETGTIGTGICYFSNGSGSTIVATNCAAHDTSAPTQHGSFAIYSSGSITTDNCVDHDGLGASYGESYHSTQTLAQMFWDATNYDYHIKNESSDLVDRGTSLSSFFTVDIDNQTRTGTWDVGADQLRFAGFAGQYSGIGSYSADLTVEAGVAVISLAGSYAGLGEFSANAKRLRSYDGMFSGIGSFGASGKRWRTFEGQYSGTESQSGSLKRIRRAIGAFAGLGTFAGNLFTGALAVLVGVFSGLGSFSASAKRWRGLESAFAGLGSFSGSAKRRRRFIGAYSGLGTFSATTFQAGIIALSGIFSGIASLSSSFKRIRSIDGQYSGNGNLSSDLGKIVVFIIDPDNAAGTDYTSLYNWAIDVNTDLVTANESYIVKCRSSSSSIDYSLYIPIDQFTTSEKNYLTIKPFEGQEHNGIWNDNIYRVNFWNLLGFNLNNNNHITIDGLQIIFAGDMESYFGIYINNSTDCVIKNCLMRTYYINNYAVYINNSTNIKIYNNIIFPDGNYSSSGIGIYTTGSGLSIIYNNTIFGLTYGIYNGSTGIFKNNICQRNILGNYINTGTVHANSKNNCTDDGTVFGSDSQTGHVKFVDEANYDFRLAYTDSVAKENGVSLSSDPDGYINFSDDIRGQSRPIDSNWDIGACESTNDLKSYPSLNGKFSSSSGWRTILKRIRRRIGRFAGIGNFRATAKRVRFLHGMFSSLSSFQATFFERLYEALAGAFAGLGSFSANARRVRFLESAMNGLGSFSGRIRRIMRVSGSYAGLGTFIASLKKRMRIIGSFGGSTYLSARMKLRMVFHVVISALGHLAGYLGTTTAEEARGTISGVGTFRGNMGRIIWSIISPSFTRKSKIKTELIEDSRMHSSRMRKSKVKELIDE